MGLTDNADTFLLSILRLTLPLILKIRRFFKFLNAIIKNMPELEDKFSVFKIHIAGKLAGGTKRTKSHSIGYGTLPVQTLEVMVSTNFLAYRHIYGEFGLKLVMCKNLKYKSPARLA
jgi:ribosomal protein S3